MQQVTVVGAGFSGLTTAYFLSKQGLRVRILEKRDRAGGLISTIRTPHGLAETAANGLLNSARLEAMCADLGVPILPTRQDGRKRYIFRGRPKQLPLRLNEVLAIGVRVASHPKSLRPNEFESIAAWGRRVLGAGATDYVLIPALGGIYAGDPERLSASLIFGRVSLPPDLATNKPEKAKVRGTVAPTEGMGQLIEGLRRYLEKHGVEFIFNNEQQLNHDEPTVVCVSARDAADYLREIAPPVSEALRGIEMLSLVTATAFYPPQAERLKGFGCLFPADQGFRARGVLFNNSIFDGRGPAHAETWIFGGARDPDIVRLSDEEIRSLIAADREKFYGATDEVVDVQVTHWPQTLPHYTLELERILMNLPALPPRVALVGNYLGRIGLAKILERAALVAGSFGERFGG
jgi:protoporphyrinogen/coproporphyrinogen III oxidase